MRLYMKIDDISSDIVTPALKFDSRNIRGFEGKQVFALIKLFFRRNDFM